jgi:hypothetical protein
MASENTNQQINPWAKTPETKAKMSLSAAKKWLSETGVKLKEKLSKLTAEKMANGKLRRSHSGYFYSKKMNKDITWFSTYELRAIYLCEHDPSVINYQTSFYYTINGRNRVADILINGKHLKEIKPKPILDKKYEKVELQIKDGQDFATKNGYTYEIWSEKELQIENQREFLKWADELRKSFDGVDQAAKRRKKALERQQRYYEKWIRHDSIVFHCKYCSCNHTMLRLTYDRDVLNNDDWVCIHENGRRTGSLPKDHLRVNNPYAAEGKKQCRGCNEIKLIQGNFTWKSKPSEKNPTGTLSADCNACRTIIEKQKYHAKKAKSKSETPL